MKLSIYKIWLFSLGFILLNTKVFAQDGIDTALFKPMGVKKMWVWVKLPILPNKSLKDSCKVEVYNFDTLTRITYQLNAVSCYGWTGSSETYHTYDSLGRLIYSKQVTEGVVTNISFTYNNKNDAVKILQQRPTEQDSLITYNSYSYNKKGKNDTLKVVNVIGNDTSRYVMTYEYDTAWNVKTIWTYTGDMKLIQKQTFDITPRSRKLLEFSTEVVLPKRSFTRGWNYYNFDAQLSRTQYSNNTWTEFVYKDNGLLDQTLSYNMEGKLNAWKTYYYEFYDN